MSHYDLMDEAERLGVVNPPPAVIDAAVTYARNSAGYGTPVAIPDGAQDEHYANAHAAAVTAIEKAGSDTDDDLDAYCGCTDCDVRIALSAALPHIRNVVLLEIAGRP